MTNVNKPSVRISSGNVSTFNKGLTLAFSNPKIKATMNSEVQVP
jgi:hypothetical protein